MEGHSGSERSLPLTKETVVPVDELPASMLKIGDIVVVRPNEIIPADGEVVEGIAMVDESAVTGEGVGRQLTRFRAFPSCVFLRSYCIYSERLRE